MRCTPCLSICDLELPDSEGRRERGTRCAELTAVLQYACAPRIAMYGMGMDRGRRAEFLEKMRHGELACDDMYGVAEMPPRRQVAHGPIECEHRTPATVYDRP
jgi:hypothetical protein